MGSMVKKFVMAVAVAAVPAMVVSAVPAHANGLTLTAAPQITDQGVWIGWVGGSGASWCTVTTDWLTSKAFQDDQCKGGVLMAAPRCGGRRTTRSAARTATRGSSAASGTDPPDGQSRSNAAASSASASR